MDTTLLQSLILALAIGAASGSIGAFIVLRRMALVGDALSHVALPGIAVGLAWQIDPLWGVVTCLLAAALIIWRLEQVTRLPAEAIVGLLFTASMAIGILSIPDTEIVESLFGVFPLLSPVFFIVIVAASGVLSVLSFLCARRFILVAISSDVAKVQGVGVWTYLLLLVIFALVVALGIKLVGTLLMGALTIIPASIAKNISRSMRGYISSAAFLGGILSVLGVGIARYFHFLPGPTIILVGIGLFLCSLAVRQR